MKRFLRSPVVNSVCISVFTVFYATVFFITSACAEFSTSDSQTAHSLWSSWRGFLAAGRQAYIAVALVAVTILIVCLLIIRRRPYDEYHASILTFCLVAAAVLTMIAIGIFYLAVLGDPSEIIEKYTLFITIHWTSVVFADLAYVMICRWR